jgi:hypothetical protein
LRSDQRSQHQENDEEEHYRNNSSRRKNKKDESRVNRGLYDIHNLFALTDSPMLAHVKDLPMSNNLSDRTNPPNQSIAHQANGYVHSACATCPFVLPFPMHSCANAWLIEHRPIVRNTLCVLPEPIVTNSCQGPGYLEIS